MSAPWGVRCGRRGTAKGPSRPAEPGPNTHDVRGAVDGTPSRRRDGRKERRDPASPRLAETLVVRKGFALEGRILGLGEQRVICTDRHRWRTERIVHAFRGQWNVEELFRRTKKGGVVPWGPSFQWADASLRLHTFATMLGLMLVALAKIALGTTASPRTMMRELAAIRATLVRPATQGLGRPVTSELPPAVSPVQAKAVRIFELARWMPVFAACRPARRKHSANAEAA